VTDPAILEEAIALNERGRVLADQGDLENAAAYYQRSIACLPTHEPAWFNLGLVHKARREWAAALDCYRHAVELGDGEKEDPAWWNLGIAATGLRRWGVAREAWRGFGLEMAAGDSEIREDYGPAPVRLNAGTPGTAEEVVWCRRIDPARAVIRNVPLAASGHRFGDIVLHDGAPNGERVLGGNVYGVFDELERWQPSAIPTFEVEVVIAGEEDAHALSELFDETGFAAQDWSKTVVPLCRACSEGRVHAEHEPAPAPQGPERIFGLAAPEHEVRRLLGMWESAERSRRRHGKPVSVA
jgi:tetratricopeptide (TPR) repeat protein